MPRSLSENPSSDADSRASQLVESTAILRKAPRSLYELILDRYDLDGVKLDRKLIRVRGDLPPAAATLATQARPSSDVDFGGRFASAAPADSGTAGRPVSRSTPADVPGDEMRGTEDRPAWRNMWPREKPWRFDEDDMRRAAPPPPRHARRAREEWNERGF